MENGGKNQLSKALYPVKLKDLKDSCSIERSSTKFFEPCSGKWISKGDSVTSRLKSKIIYLIIYLIIEIKRGTVATGKYARIHCAFQAVSCLIAPRKGNARMSKGTEIRLAPAEDLRVYFFPFFQNGVYVKGSVNVSVKTFLAQEMQIDAEYLEKRIQTVFLNGKAVDALDSAIVMDGSVLTLSAAMPGLLGATMRVGSRYAPMRSQVSHHVDNVDVKPGEGRVLLKLFNLLIDELGPGLLRRGVWIAGGKLEAFFKEQPDAFWRKCKKARLNGKPVNSDSIKNQPWTESSVLLRLEDP
jgi:hypothetical protein